MFLPIVPDTGLAGWRFLQRTYDSQFEAFNRSVVQQRDTDYFHERIGSVNSAEDLVSDRRLLTIALGAFGLQDDINNRYFIQKVLEDGTTSDDALSSRLADTRYSELSKAFGFGPIETVQTYVADFAERIVQKYQANSFEVAAGEQNDAMRVALYAQRELPGIASMEGSIDTKWFTIMGDPPLRKLFEQALNLPSSIGQIDIDQQLGVFKERASAVFGSDDLSRFSESDARENIVVKFIVRDQINGTSAGLSSGAIALTLLGS